MNEDTNLTALEGTLERLHQTGRVEDVDAAWVQMLRSMARSLDLDSSNAALWRQYREALRELTADDASESVDDALRSMFT